MLSIQAVYLVRMRQDCMLSLNGIPNVVCCLGLFLGSKRSSPDPCVQLSLCASIPIQGRAVCLHDPLPTRHDTLSSKRI